MPYLGGKPSRHPLTRLSRAMCNSVIWKFGEVRSYYLTIYGQDLIISDKKSERTLSRYKLVGVSDGGIE